MDLPQPPQDTDLRNIIDKLAQFVARNGPEFELMTKSKQKNNPKFSFLYGGEHFNYYQYKVTTEQAILKQVSDRRGDSGYTAQSGQFTMNQQPGPIMNIQQGLAMAGGLPVRPELSQWLSRHVLPEQNPTIPASLPGPPAVEVILGQQTVLQEQIKQSEANLNAQQAVLVQQQQSEIEKAVANEQAKMIQNLSDECNISLTEFDAILQPIIDSCTKDSISAGKGWILSHATTHDAGTVIAQYLLRTLTEISENFTQKLHIIYLVNDVLHHCARKNADDLKKCLETAVVPMFCNASIDVTEEQETKLNKLLKLWESKSNYFDSSVIDKMKDPTNSYQEYQANLISQYANLITPLAQQSKTTFDNYQKQHQAFVAHTVRQIQQLEIQKQVLEGQVTMNQQMNPDQNTLMGQNNLANQVKQNQNFGPPGFTEPNMFTQQGSIPGNPMMPYDQPGFCNPNSNQSMFPPNELAPNEIGYGSSNGQQGNTNESGCYDFDHSYNSNNDAANNTADDAINELSINLSQPPPGFFTDSLPPSFQNGLPDLSKPPPGFNNVPEVCPEDLMPSVPYFELPAGLMVPLIMLEDSDYKPLDPDAIRLPPPAPPSERLLLAVDAFYSKPSHTRPQDRYQIKTLGEGWEKLGLYEYYKTKNSVRQQKEEDIRKGKRVKSRSPTPVQYDYLGNRSPPTRRYRSKSRSKSRERSRSKSPMIPCHRSVSPTDRERSIGRRSGRRSRRSPVASPPPSMMAMTASPDRASPEMIGFKGTGQSGRSFKPSDRSPSPPGFSTGASFSNSSSQLMEMSELDPSNKGHQMLRKMGWGQGLGLGAAGQGIVAPIDAGSVRDHQDKYKGVGVNLNDPYENFRKNKGAAFITRMKERALERT